jgi:molybdate transport system substrate-binding protein
MQKLNCTVGATVALATLCWLGCRSETSPPAGSSPPAGPPVRVAAAADLTAAFDEMGRTFESQTGLDVTFTFGSTGLLTKQLKEGTPFDMFAAANESFVEQAITAGACDGATKAPYARGRIAIWAKHGGVALPKNVAELADERFKRIAIANPEHAPYGQAAKEALEHENVWESIQPRLVLGENVRQTLQFAKTGNVEVAIVALSLVVKDKGNPWLLIDEALHRPIDQALVVCTRGSNRAGGDAFAKFVNSEAGRDAMRGFGFLLPGERLSQNP